MKKAITKVEVKPLTVDGLVGKVVQIEKMVAALINEAKEFQRSADELRDKIFQNLKAFNLKSVKHESGYQAVLVAKQSIKIIDEPALIGSLEKLKVDGLLTTVIPEHREVKQKLWEQWAKEQNLSFTDLTFKGIEVKESEYLSIIKPK